MPVIIYDENRQPKITLHDEGGTETIHVNVLGKHPGALTLINDKSGRDTIDHAIACSRIVPESGSFRGWKKCRDDVLVQLEILEDARRDSMANRECRAEAARVLQVVGADVGFSRCGGPNCIEYRVGEIVRCHEWNPGDRWSPRSGGIYFYLSRIEAEVAFRRGPPAPIVEIVDQGESKSI